MTRMTKRKTETFGKTVHNPSESYVKLQLSEDEREALNGKGSKDLYRDVGTLLGAIAGTAASVGLCLAAYWFMAWVLR